MLKRSLSDPPWLFSSFSYRKKQPLVIMRLTSFEDVIHPVPFHEFLKDNWEQVPVVISRNDPSYYASLFSLDDLPPLLWSARPSWGSVQLARHERKDGWVDMTQKPPNLERLLMAFQQGDTIVLNDLQLHSKEVALLTRNIEARFGFVTNVNLYLTPTGSQGLSPHFDTQDVFILQIEGRKRWRLYEPWLELPLDDMAQVLPKDYEGALQKELTLKAGDMLYIPRGMVHEAMTGEEMSLHLTIGITILTWKRLLEAILQIESRKSEGRFLREALPVGIVWGEGGEAEFRLKAEKVLLDLVRRCQVDKALDDLTERVLERMEPIPDGNGFREAGREGIGPKTVLRKRAGTLCQVFREEDTVRLHCTAGSGLRGQKQLEPALSFIASSETFIVESLPGNFTMNAKIVLVSRLIKEGVLIREDS